MSTHNGKGARTMMMDTQRATHFENTHKKHGKNINSPNSKKKKNNNEEEQQQQETE